MKRIDWFEVALVIVVMATSLYAALSDAPNLSTRWFTRDDAYYYFKVAQNISEGNGSTFDGINRTNGYHPLWLFICVPIFALARFDLILPLRILLLILSGLSAATAILMYRMIGRIFTPALGAITAVCWAFSRDVLVRVYQQGLETGIAAFTIILFIYKLFEFEKSWRNRTTSIRQVAELGLFAVLAMFSRLDLVFLAGMAGLWIVFRKHPMRYLLPIDILSIVVPTLLILIYRVTFRDYYRFSDVALTMIALGLIIKIPAAYFLGFYQRSVITNHPVFLKRRALFAVSTSAILGALMIAITPIAQFEGFPRIAIVYDLIVTFFIFGLTRAGVIGLNKDLIATDTEPSPAKLLSASWKTWLTDGLAYYGVVFGALGIYMVWNKLAFGTFSPVSGQIKRWWGSLSGNVYGGSASNLLTFFGIDHFDKGNVWHPVSTLLGNWATGLSGIGLEQTQWYLIFLAIFGLVFYFILWVNKEKARDAITRLGLIPLIGGAWLQVISYHATGYSAFMEWYWISQLITVFLALSLAAGMAYQAVHKFPRAHYALWIIAISTGLAMGVSQWRYIHQTMPHGKAPADAPYNEVAAFLEEHTDPGSIIGMTGGGNAGYFIKDRTVVNMDGLINSYEYYQLLKNRQAGRYLAEIGMDYILANTLIINQLPYNRQYTPYTKPMGFQYGGKDLLRYHPTARD